MEELIGRIAANVGIDEGLARNAVGIILNFLNKEAPADKMQTLLAAIPGAGDMVESSGESSGGLGGMLGGMMGGMGGAMAAMNELTSAGLDMGQVQSVTREVVGYAKEKAGDDIVDQIVGNIPGLSQFV